MLLKNLKIGIIGGAGPMAGVIFTKKIIEYYQNKYNCYKDQDFPEIILLSIPFAEMLEPNSINQKETLVSIQLEKAISTLYDLQCNKIIIACNTLHCFLKTNKNILNIVESTKQYIDANISNSAKILSLNTSTSENYDLYNLQNKVSIDKQDQKKIDSIILQIMKGAQNVNEIILIDLIESINIRENGEISHIILGCTEFSVLNDTINLKAKIKKKFDIEIIDPLEIAINKL